MARSTWLNTRAKKKKKKTRFRIFFFSTPKAGIYEDMPRANFFPPLEFLIKVRQMRRCLVCEKSKTWKLFTNFALTVAPVKPCFPSAPDNPGGPLIEE